jgi:hypothetical protein
VAAATQAPSRIPMPAVRRIVPNNRRLETTQGTTQRETSETTQRTQTESTRGNIYTYCT